MEMPTAARRPLWDRDVRGDRFPRIRDPAERFDLSRKATQDNSTLELFPARLGSPFARQWRKAPGESGWIPIPASRDALVHPRLYFRAERQAGKRAAGTERRKPTTDTRHECQDRHRSSTIGISASWPTSMPGKRPRPSADRKSVV